MRTYDVQYSLQLKAWFSVPALIGMSKKTAMRLWDVMAARGHGKTCDFFGIDRCYTLRLCEFDEKTYEKKPLAMLIPLKKRAKKEKK